MYIPSAFAVTDPAKIAEVISTNGFGLLISSGDGSPFASHLPFIHHPERGPNGVLLSHMARANRHWQLFHANEEALVIFNGPHAYISPSYYVTEVAVPTWNYVTVHVYGKTRLMETEAELRQVLDETVAKYESARPEPWSTAKLPAEMENKLHQMIVGFEIEITRIEGKFKLGQNRSLEDREKMLHALQAASDVDSQQLARFVEQTLTD
jgi:transcriptional regulator